MDNKKIGEFISSLRKEAKLTQKELATKLFVSDKAVSKWERGLCMPDVSLIEKLAKILKVSVSEILKGEKITEITKSDSDNIVKNSINYFQKKHFTKKITKIIKYGVLIYIIGYLIILALGEYHYGELPIKMINGYGSIDLPSFSAKINHQRTKGFVKALKENDYYLIEDRLLAVYDSTPYIKWSESKSEETYIPETNTHFTMEWYYTMINKAEFVEDYTANLKEMKSLGFEITKYKLERCNFYGCSYDLEFAYGGNIYEMSLWLETKQKSIIINGYGWGQPTRFGNAYTIEDLKTHDYEFYLKLEKMLVF